MKNNVEAQLLVSHLYDLEKMNSFFLSKNRQKMLWEKAMFDSLAVEQNAQKYSDKKIDSRPKKVIEDKQLKSIYLKGSTIKNALNPDIYIKRPSVSDNENIRETNSRQNHLLKFKESNFIQMTSYKRISLENTHKQAMNRVNHKIDYTDKKFQHDLLIKETLKGYEVWIWEKNVSSLNVRNVMDIFKDYFKHDSKTISKLTINGKEVFNKNSDHRDEIDKKTLNNSSSLDRKY